jgi:hypothetical protein
MGLNLAHQGMSTEWVIAMHSAVWYHAIIAILSVQEKNKQTAAWIYLNGQLIENGLVVTTNSSATAEQSEILE